MAVLEPAMRRAYIIIGLACLALLSSCLMGCSKSQDAKPDAAKMDRSKIDDEVNQSQNDTNAATPSGAQSTK